MFKYTNEHNGQDINSNGKFKLLYESNPLMIFVVSKEGVILEVNNRVKQHLGYKPKELVGTQAVDIFHPEDKEKVQINFDDCLSNDKQGYTWELRKVAKDGKVVWVKETISTVINPSNEKELFIICENISDYKDIIHEVKESEEEYKLLTEKTNDIVILHDIRGKIRYCNKAALNISGYTEQEIKNVNIDSFFCIEYNEKVVQCLNSSAGIENSFICESDLITKDGIRIPIEINLSKLAKEGKSEDLLVVARDIRERKKIEQHIRQSNEELKEANMAKDKFFSIIAHDLKGPFNALLGYSDLLIGEFDDLNREEIKEYIMHMHNVSQNVYDLLNNLLDWSRIQTKNIFCEPEVFHVKATIEKAIRLYNDTASKKSINIKIDADERLTAYGDENMVYTVLRNLISNAIKFTNKNGKIEIKVEEEGEFIRTTIADNGIGMSEEDMCRLFKLDINNTTLGTHKESGTGLGLILSKELIEKNNGKILITSNPGEGSSFSFTLPSKQQ